MLMPLSSALSGIFLAFVLALIAAKFFPAQTQSKIWVKVFGSEWGTSAKGRVWDISRCFNSRISLMGSLVMDTYKSLKFLSF
jgi:hypothetical protein